MGTRIDQVQAVANGNSALITNINTSQIGYCRNKTTKQTTEHGDKTACVAAGHEWMTGLPWATAVKQVSATYNGSAVTLAQQFDAIYGPDGLRGQYTVKIDNDGYVSGFGLASTPVNGAPFSEFLVRADRFAIAAPSTPALRKTVSSLTRSGTTATCVTSTVHDCRVDDYIAISEASSGLWNLTFKVLTVPNATTLTFTVDGTAPTPATPVTGQTLTLSKVCLPFIVTTTARTYTVNGEVVETVYPGVYITDAAIQNATISGAQIKNATIESAKIFSLTADKIASGDIQVGNCIQSATDWSTNTPMWQICGNGVASFRGLTIYGSDGSVLLSSGGGVAGASANLIPNSAFAGLSGTNPPPWTIFSGTGGSILVNPWWAPARPAGVNALLFYRDGYETTTFIFGHTQQRLSVLPSTKYEYSAYIASYNQNIDLVIGWHDAAGTLVASEIVAQHTAASTVPDLTKLANWSRVGNYNITSPSTAVSASFGFQVNPRIRSTTFPHTYIARPYFGRAREGQTALSPWSTAGENALYDVYAKSMAVGGYLKSTSFNGTPDNLLGSGGNVGTAGWCINGKGEAVFDGLHVRAGTLPPTAGYPGSSGFRGKKLAANYNPGYYTVDAITFNFTQDTVVQFLLTLNAPKDTGPTLVSFYLEPASSDPSATWVLLGDTYYHSASFQKSNGRADNGHFIAVVRSGTRTLNMRLWVSGTAGFVTHCAVTWFAAFREAEMGGL